MKITEELLANTLRILSADAVEKANSGHPGMPMGMADIATVLWRKHIRHSPQNPSWINRDRFILSNGHGSMLIYSILHFTGYKLSIREIKKFRQLFSKTPGHPEYGLTPGIETTTGPLGQGLCNGVGMAICEKKLASNFNKPSLKLIDHYTYVSVGDGCLMEGISHEAASLAGVLKLNKLIVIYDDNGISIDSDKGDMKSWYNENTKKRFEAYGWNVIDKVDGHNHSEIDLAFKSAKKEKARPTLICFKTIIGKGSPNKENTGSVHGAPLGETEIFETRKNLSWNFSPFNFPKEIYKKWDYKTTGSKLEKNWDKLFNIYKKKYPALSKEFTRRLKKEFPENWQSKKRIFLNNIKRDAKDLPTRKSSNLVLDFLGDELPELLGGSADLAPSNLTMHKKSKPINTHSNGNYLFYGVREFGMSACMNGISLYGFNIPYGGTFLVFSDYSRNAIRLAALMKLRVIFVFTHDSIFLGEDGPTHQPIEQMASLRLIPNLNVWRPCDSEETAIAWIESIEKTGNPTALLLSRQKLPFQIKKSSRKFIKKGGYILIESIKPEIVIIATGSEIQIAVECYELLKKRGIKCSVVSMPSTTTFDKQSRSYKEKVLPQNAKKVVIEAGITDFWYKYVGKEGLILGVDCYGESAPGEKVYEHFEFNAKKIQKKIMRLIKDKDKHDN